MNIVGSFYILSERVKFYLEINCNKLEMYILNFRVFIKIIKYYS